MTAMMDANYARRGARYRAIAARALRAQPHRGKAARGIAASILATSPVPVPAIFLSPRVFRSICLRHGRLRTSIPRTRGGFGYTATVLQMQL